MRNRYKIAGLGALLLGAWCFGQAQAPRSTITFQGQPQPKDLKVMDTWLRIEHRDNTIFMQPLLPPTFKLVLMSGEGAQPDQLTKCGVYRHYMPPNPDGTGIIVTVLKCPGGNSYGISELDFQADAQADTDTKPKLGTPAGLR